jgi:carbon monoxide dehydrogenase subunit G
MAIHIENELTVPAPVDQVWDFLSDPERVAPCMPGAELTEVVDDNHYKGKVNVKMGPVSLSFAGDVNIVERDEAAKRMVMKAKGSEQKGKGQASATVTSQLQSSGGGTRMRITQDIDVSGALAQFGRGMIQDVTGSLMNQFAGAIETELQSARAPAAAGDGRAGARAAAPARARPAAQQAQALSGFSLGWMAIKSFVRRFFKNTFDFKDTAY